MTATLLQVHGQLQIESDVVHLVAKSFTDLSHLTARLRDEGPAADSGRKAGGLIHSRDFH